MSASERRIELSSGELRLEGAIADGDGALAAVVLHPHPQYGGDMDNIVVIALCQALAARGATALRFNFRGTGRSQGAYSGGAGEADDARAALAYLRQAAPGAGIVTCGYSFGAMVAASVAADADLNALVLVSPPVGVGPIAFPPRDLDVLYVTGDGDRVAPADSVRELASEDRHRAVVLAGADHSWWGHTAALTREVSSFLDDLGSRA